MFDMKLFTFKKSLSGFTMYYQNFKLTDFISMNVL